MHYVFIKLTETFKSSKLGDVMALWHLRSRKKPTGGVLRRNKKKSRRERGSDFLEVRIGKRKVAASRGLGGNPKLKTLYVSEANVLNPKTGRYERTKIISVEKNPANQHYARRDTVTRGAVVKTESGLVRVTSRPSQNGVVNAVLVEEKKGK
jgi:small subunit ribosomal protein S8e